MYLSSFRLCLVKADGIPGISDFEDYNSEDATKVLNDFEVELRVLAGALEYFSKFVLMYVAAF